MQPGTDGCSFDPWTDPVGDLSFSADTLVLLASGKSVPISQVKLGDKVLTTNTKTGSTQAEAVMAVMVHRDSDLFDLKITDRGKTTVIRTTTNHPFWVPAVGGRPGQWVTAVDLKPGTRLRTPSGSNTAIAVVGWIPKQREGWMWDLTVPGDHDFYVKTTAGSVLVHNLTDAYIPPPPQKILPGFPNAKYIGYRGGRATWQDGKYTLQWDYQHGAVEMYSKSKTHLGEYDPDTGVQTKGPVQGRTPCE
jgi:hypothetical protein